MLTTDDRLRVLALGAHCDDIELGCAGFLFRLLREQAAKVTYLIFSPGRHHPTPGLSYDESQRRAEARASAIALLSGVENPQPAPIRVEVLDYEDCKLHNYVHELIQEIERRLYDEEGRRQFDLILTHSGGDSHYDHRQVHGATISASRAFGGIILMYQAPSSIPNEFKPNFFVELDAQAAEQKIRAIQAHDSQRHKEYMTREWIEGMGGYWGLLRRLPGKLLEAFEIHQAFWNTYSPKRCGGTDGSEGAVGRDGRSG